VQVRADKCLIVNTKGGGHAFIGLYLAKELLAKGHDVTIFNDGDAVSNRSRGLRKGLRIADVREDCSDVMCCGGQEGWECAVAKGVGAVAAVDVGK
jgi:nucleoside-diphosphate-sugar epimerase